MGRLTNADAFAKASPKEILAKVGEIIDQERARTTLFSVEALEHIPLFDRKEMQLGKVVGRGGFGVVREITAINLAQEDASVTSKSSSSQRRFRKPNNSSSGGHNSNEPSVNGESSQRELLARKVWSKRTSKYVFKEVEPDLLHTDRVTFLKGLVDLGLEAHYLGSLNHNHVLKLRGMSMDGASEKLGFFIVLDQLQEILSKKLNRWMHQKRASNGITGVVTGGRKNKERLLMERILVAYDIADAMEYIHRKKIVFRDLKHDNIGFDTDNILKIFDFGLAKELQESEREGDTDLYNMTGMTGALRYMAPEVGLLKPYNQKVDVYSWAMLMWYIMALEPPLGMYTPNMFLDRVFGKGYRPAIKDKWPEGIQSLIRESWDDDCTARPSFAVIKRRLKAFAREQDPGIYRLMGDDNNRSHSRPRAAEDAED